MPYDVFMDSLCKPHRKIKKNTRRSPKKSEPLFGDFDDLFYKQTQEFALICSGNNESFKQLLESTTFDKSFLYEIRKKLENKLDHLKRTKSENLHQLLVRTCDEDIITKDAKNLGLFILGQRNIVAHEEIDEITYKSRIMLVLHAAAILWPQLPD